MDGELIKYLIYLWMLASAGVGGIKFLSDLIGTAKIRVTSPEVRRYKSAELFKCFCFLIGLFLLLGAAYVLAKYMGSMTS